MEWKLKIYKTEEAINYEIGNGLYMIINYSKNPMIQFKGTEEQLKAMGFVKIGKSVRLNMYMTIEFVTNPCYKGKFMLPNGEIVEIILYLDEKGEEATLCFPHGFFERIVLDVKNQEVTLQVDIAQLKAAIENSNRLCMEELSRDVCR